ncbi:copper resistance D family protein [Azospirillum rugosum]|uniref:Copper resistance protein D n=1 Tax=Azospirillum rugosum TaxID=416170 RepID=A0ABS4SJW8_9PROT|nr:CopD family protein [Azospirillum rugosum]MBP2291685.1 putative copper resistance protein D [Azospirillum rugosum]MDQ0524503.1 putative copper resistance protein D [Azospirillum rugosum]
MELLTDIFGLLSVMLRALVLVGTMMAVGGCAFLLLLAQPLRPALAGFSDGIETRSRHILRWSALGLALVVAADAAVGLAVLEGTTELPLRDLVGAEFVVAGAVSFAAALALAAVAGRGANGLLALLSVLLLGALVATSHSAARPEERGLLLAFTALHVAGAAVWIGGLPYLVSALSKVGLRPAWALIGRRYSMMAVGSVAALLVGGVGLAVVFVGDPGGIWGTAYGLMLSSKAMMFAGLLVFGALNFRMIERALRGGPSSALRMRRFAEAEIGIGFTVLFAAASLTSLPPAVDLQDNRVTLHEIAERLEPRWPSMNTPDHGSLAIPALQAKLDSQAKAEEEAAPRAFVPGAGAPPPRNAADIAWSEYNHHWAGLIVLAVGFAALLEKTGRVPIARHWPLLFLALAVFLLVRSDPEGWPLGDIGFFESFRDPEVVQHRLLVLLVIGFAAFEWGVRTGKLKTPWTAMVFPLLTAVGAGLLLTHSHQLANIREELLIEMTHTPLALFGVAGAWARWLEIRLPEGERRLPGIVWPVCFMLVGLVLLGYRET